MKKIFLSLILSSLSLSSVFAQAHFPQLTCEMLEKVASEQGGDLTAADLFKPKADALYLGRIAKLVRASMNHHWGDVTDVTNDRYRPDMSIEELDELGEGIFVQETELELNNVKHAYTEVSIGFGGGNGSKYYFESVEGNARSVMAPIFFYDGDCSPTQK